MKQETPIATNWVFIRRSQPGLGWSDSHVLSSATLTSVLHSVFSRPSKNSVNMIKHLGEDDYTHSRPAVILTNQAEPGRTKDPSLAVRMQHTPSHHTYHCRDNVTQCWCWINAGPAVLEGAGRGLTYAVRRKRPVEATQRSSATVPAGHQMSC